MRLMGLSSNIMSLGGIAIAVGAMVDAAIVVVEQTHKKLEEWMIWLSEWLDTCCASLPFRPPPLSWP